MDTIIMTEHEFGKRKWEVSVDNNGVLWERYYEYYRDGGWKQIGLPERISRSYFEEMYNVEEV